MREDRGDAARGRGEERSQTRQIPIAPARSGLDLDGKAIPPALDDEVHLVASLHIPVSQPRASDVLIHRG